MAGKFVEKLVENAMFSCCMRVCMKDQKNDVRKIQYVRHGSHKMNGECNMLKPGDSILLADGSQNVVESAEMWATGTTTIEEL